MSESEEHKSWKKFACDCGGNTEHTLPSGRRLDCLNVDDKFNSCAEVEFSRYRIPKAVERLDEAQKKGLCHHPRLIVNDDDFDMAKQFVLSKNIEVIPKSKLWEIELECMLKNL